MAPEQTAVTAPHAVDRLTVLLVDSDEGQRSVVTRALEERGHRVAVSPSGRDAVRRFAAEAFDGVVLAHALPDLPALEVVRGVLALRHRVPVILVVPIGFEDLEIQALRAGVAQTMVITPRYEEFIPGILEHEVHLVRMLDELEQAEKAEVEALSLRRRALEQLAESEKRFTMAVSQAPVVMWTADRELRFTWATGAVLDHLGLDIAALRGRPVADVFPGEGSDSPIEMHGLALLGRSVHYEYAWKGRWFDVRVEPIRGDDGAVRGLIGIAVDLTDRRRAEEALRLSDERFVLLGRATNDMAWDWDLETDSIWRNENLFTVFGYTADDMEPAGAWWELRIHPDERERVIQGLHEAIAGGDQFWSAEYRWQRKDGTYADILDRGYVLHDENGKPVRMVGSTMDITERRREEAIRDAVYRISEAAVTAKDLPALYAEVHKIVGQLMPAENFYIALHDPATDTLSFPYFVDEEEPAPAPYKAGRGLTEYVLRSGKPFYASTEGYERLVAEGEVVRVGPMSIDWVGVPLIAHGATIGALVLQTYTEGVRYGEKERDILGYVSEQIAMAIERKQTEEALRQSEERYRMLFESNPTPMWVYDLATLRFLAVNDIAVQHYGYTRDEFLAMTIKDIRPPEYVDALVASVREPRDEISHSGTWRHRTKDGRLVDVEIVSHTLTWNGHPAVLVMASDVTRRKQDEAALVAAEARFRSLVEQSFTGIYILQGPRFVYVNPRFAEMHGYTTDEILSSVSPMDLIAPEDRDAAAENIRRGLSGEPIAIRHSVHALRKDGTRISVGIQAGPIEYEGRPAIIGSILDVTEQERAVDKLRTSEARFRALFEAAADAILLINRKGEILDVNPATEVLARSDRKELVGSMLEQFLPQEDLERARAYLRNVFQARYPSEPFEVTVLLPSGLRRSIAVRTRLVSDPGREPYAEMIIRDITEQLEMQRRLLASERLASVGQMAAYIAHEINTPLANISLLAAASKRRTEDAAVRDRLERIDIQRRQAAAIIADLLSFTKHRDIQPVEVDLRSVVTAAADQMDPYRSKDVDLVLEMGDAPVMGHVDPLQMQEVVVNLLRNALEATPKGSVTVRLEARPGYRILTVADTGHGIPPDVQDRLFQPFVTTKRHKGGTGLGLALCRNIVTAHGGEIHFTSAPSRGTTFTVILPQEDAA